MQSEDFRLHPAELALLTDPNIMPLKHALLAKIEKYLQLLRYGLHHCMKPVASHFPPEFDLTEGKISRGDNYKTYPYRVLDFPKAMSGKDVFTFRSMLLWGHHCSFHLILMGHYKERFQDRIIQQATKLPESLSLSQQATPWEWEFEKEDYIQARALQEAPVAEAVRENEFLKISFFMPLEQYMDIPTTGTEIWKLWQVILFE